MSDSKPIRIEHNIPAFDSTPDPTITSVDTDDEELHIVSTPTKRQPHRIVSMHYNTPDGRPVSEHFQEEGTVDDGIIDPKPILLPDSSPATKVGVRAMDAALLLSDGNEEAAKQTVTRWQKMRTWKTLESIGIDQNHKQVKLYEPPAFSKWLKKNDELTGRAETEFSKELAATARPART
jgi:hypothetical protein